METASEQKQPFFLVGRHVSVRRGLGVMFLALGVAEVALGWIGPWTDIMSAVLLMASGVLLWTRMWQVGMWCAYTAFGLVYVSRGLIEHKIVLVLGGALMLALLAAWGIYVVASRLRNRLTTDH